MTRRWEDRAQRASASGDLESRSLVAPEAGPHRHCPAADNHLAVDSHHSPVAQEARDRFEVVDSLDGPESRLDSYSQACSFQRAHIAISTFQQYRRHYAASTNKDRDEF